MSKITRICSIAVSTVLVLGLGVALADVVPIPITAEQAFDAVADQTDPLTGEPASVRIVDIRSAAEYSWVGTCAQVDRIVLKFAFGDREIAPDKGKVKLILGGRQLQFKLHGWRQFMPLTQAEEIETSLLREDIGGVVNIPYKTWVDDNCEGDLCDMPEDLSFKLRIEALSYEGVDVIILMCRSGGRTSACVADFATTLFTAVYEIDRSDKDGRGGFEGSTYANFYNGYRGFPGRATGLQDHKSVSWCDAGLPIYTGACPPRSFY